MSQIETENKDLQDLFPHPEHRMALIYGRLGQGKTAVATAMALDTLYQGGVVYSNYPIQWDGYDQAHDWRYLLLGMIGLKRKFLYFPKENWHYIAIDDKFHDTFGKITDALVVLDEGHVPFDSYQMAKMSLVQRANVLHGRHFDRSILIVSQRPTAVHVVVRANINNFYKVTRIWNIGFVLFRRQEFDLGGDETVDEEECLGTRYFFGSKRLFKAYDTKYLRGKLPGSQRRLIAVQELSWFGRVSAMVAVFRRRPYRSPLVDFVDKTQRVQVDSKPLHVVKKVKVISMT